MKSFHKILISALVLSLIPTFAALAKHGRSIIIVGCDRGKVSVNQVFDPRRSIGNPGDKIANWHIALAQKGRYDMRFFSPHPYHMFAFRKNSRTGQWVSLRISGPGKRQGKGYTWRMRVSRAGNNNEEYLLQAKPARQAQNYRHVFNGVIQPSGCPKRSPKRHPVSPCPPGYYDDGNGIFGQPNCVKR